MTRTAILTALLVLAGPAVAQNYYANLSGALESQPNSSGGKGVGMAMLGKDLTIVMQWQGLSGPVTAGHLHCCAAPGQDAGVALPLSPAASPDGNLSASIDLDKAESYTPAFLGANGGSAAGARAALLKGLAEGGGYLNLHTDAHPKGEVRGNLRANQVDAY